jgi:hypothetical protein
MALGYKATQEISDFDPKTLPKPPNFAEPGESETTKANGVISFGPFAGGPSTTNVGNPYFGLTKESLNK